MHLTRVSILVCVDRIVDETSFNNFIEVIMIILIKRNCLKNYCALEQMC
jgi:hypothetical protein